MANYSLSLRGREGFKKVWTPHITKTDLYKKSGHYAKFGDELFMVHSQVNGEDFAMKPMNCPHHAQIFASKPRTYREMPVRYMEATTDYRDEKTGELGGLSRVRSLTQDDSHVFCRKDQIKEEVKRLVGIVKELYETMGMQKLRARLSYRSDEDKYLGDKKLWDMAQKQIKQAAIDNGLEYFEQEGEAEDEDCRDNCLHSELRTKNQRADYEQRNVHADCVQAYLPRPNGIKNVRQTVGPAWSHEVGVDEHHIADSKQQAADEYQKVGKEPLLRKYFFFCHVINFY
jgi:histidyl-tRNA synthetase